MSYRVLTSTQNKFVCNLAIKPCFEFWQIDKQEAFNSENLTGFLFAMSSSKTFGPQTWPHWTEFAMTSQSEERKAVGGLWRYLKDRYWRTRPLWFCRELRRTSALIWTRTRQCVPSEDRQALCNTVGVLINMWFLKAPLSIWLTKSVAFL